jgi:ketosteroid isomerase-like protein
MENAMKELLETYYRGFSQKRGWEDTIADDFQFVGGDMTKPEPVKGKQAYIEVIKRFSKVFKDMRVTKMIVNGDQACVIGNYDFSFPSGQQVNGNVAEIWTAKDGKLQSLAIYFDTLTFSNNTKP